MSISRRVARPLLASMFIAGGADALLHPDAKAPAAEGVHQALGEPMADTKRLVQLNGAVQLGAGVCLATGRVPRLAAAALAGSLVPTTYAGHAFWTIDDPAKWSAQRIQFLKNASMLGGLVLAATDARQPRRRTAGMVRRAAGVAATTAAAGRWTWGRARQAGVAGESLGRDGLRAVSDWAQDEELQARAARLAKSAVDLARQLPEAV